MLRCSIISFTTQVLKKINPLHPSKIFKRFLGITVKTAIMGILFYFVKDIANR